MEDVKNGNDEPKTVLWEGFEISLEEYREIQHEENIEEPRYCPFSCDEEYGPRW